jgi:hypothetical protein
MYNPVYLRVCQGKGNGSTNARRYQTGFDWQVAANTGLGLIDSVARYDLRGSVAYENRPERGGRGVVRFPRSTLELDLEMHRLDSEEPSEAP